MTKKTIYIIITVILVALLLYFYKASLYKEKPSVKKEVVKVEKPVEVKEEVTEKVRGIESFIPDGGLLYINFRDLKKVYNEVSKTNFFNKFIALKVFDNLRADIEAFNKEPTFDISFENTLKVFGNDLFISIYYNEQGKKSDILMTTVLDESVSYIAKMFNFLAQVTKTEDQTSEVGKETYNDIDISYILDKKTNEYFYYLIIDNIAHFSSNMDIMKNVVDLSQKKQKNTLSSSKNYEKAKKNFRPNNFFNLYYDFQSLAKIQEIIGEKYKEQVKAGQSLEKALPGVDNYDLLYADAVVNEGIDLIATVSLKGDASDEYMKFLDDLHGEPAVSSFNDFIKDSPLFYSAYTNVSIKKYYENMKKLALKDPNNKVKEFEDGFSQFLGFSLPDDLLPLFGDELVYACTGINTEVSFFPVPDFFIGVKLKDIEKFKEIYGKINEALVSANPNLSIKEEEYKQNKYSFMLTQFGIAPGHGIVGDYYIIFASPPTFNVLVDGLGKDAVSYFDSNRQKPMNKNIYGKYNYFSYMDSKLFLQQVPGLFDKYSPLLQGSMTNEQRRDFLKTYNDQILPLIETLKVFDRFIWSGYYDKGKKQFRFKSLYKMEDI